MFIAHLCFVSPRKDHDGESDEDETTELVHGYLLRPHASPLGIAALPIPRPREAHACCFPSDSPDSRFVAVKILDYATGKVATIPSVHRGGGAAASLASLDVARNYSTGSDYTCKGDQNQQISPLHTQNHHHHQQQNSSPIAPVITAPSLQFHTDSLKVHDEAVRYVQRYFPALAKYANDDGYDVVVCIGTMSIDNLLPSHWHSCDEPLER